MAAVVVDSSLAASKQQAIRPSDQFRTTPATTVTSRIGDKRNDQHHHRCSTNSTHSNVPASSTNMLNLEKSPNLISGCHPTQSSHLDVKSPLSGIEPCLSDAAKRRVAAILSDVEKLSDIEKLYLYLQLPDGTHSNSDNVTSNDKKKVLYNPFGKKTDTEVVQTYTWIQSHLEEDATVSIPKFEVYQDYQTYCEANKFEKLCVADFGKAMKYIFPNVKPRRLGQRGNSKYCYSGLRKKILVESPELPVLDTSEYRFGSEERGTKKSSSSGSGSSTANETAWNVILQWVENRLERKFKSNVDCARFLSAMKPHEEQQQHPGFKATNHMAPNYTCKTQTANNKKKEVGNSINKKLHDKKKCDILNGVSPAANGGAVRAKANCSKADGGTIHSVLASLNASQVSVKTEPIDTAFCISNNSKVPISCNNALAVTSATPAIILLSGSQTGASATLTNQLPAGHIKSPTQLTTNQAISAIVNGSTIKYKAIQPKPANIELARCFADSESRNNNNNFNAHIALNADKRRHSVATPFNVDASKVNIKRDNEGLASFGSELKLSEGDKNFKRQMDEKDFQFISKKRHVEESIAQMPQSILISSLTGGKSSGTTTLAENSDLKVNEIETEALFDYLNCPSQGTTPFEAANNNNSSNGNNPRQNTAPTDNSKDINQIRKLLESNLPNFRQHNGGSPGSGGNVIKSNDGDCMNGLSSMYNIDHSNSNSMSAMPSNFGGNFQFNDNNSSLCSGGGGMGTPKEMASSLDGMSASCSLPTNSNGQIPPSPNSRRLQFNFQPISPRNTPTIPENSALDMNMLKQTNSNSNNYNNGFNSQSKQMNTVAVGPSQPPSENNSPFISPRNTPISVSRSRNNSGQSTYSNYRQTPMQNSVTTNFDSGVSSISSSPFVSPHPTPIPGTSRIRPLDINLNNTGTNNLSRNLARVRHSSGPGGPINRGQMSHVMTYHRSNSLSPMVSDGSFPFSNPIFYSSNQTQTLNSMASGGSDLGNKCNVVTQTDLKSGHDVMMPFNTQLLDSLPFQTKSSMRQRHFSNPYGAMASNSALMKPEEEDESIKMLLNRSQSVPLSQMFQSNAFDSNSPLEGPFDSFALSSNTSDGGISELESATFSKSYPSTPLCTNESFKLPHHSSMGASTSTVSSSMEGNGFFDMLINNDSVIQSGQDLIVSSVQLNQGINNEANATTSSVDELNAPSSPLMLAKPNRDEFNDLLISEDNGLDQFTDGFRDCDNDFSSIGLENQSNTYDVDVFGVYK